MLLIKLYSLTLIIFTSLDFVWVGFLAKRWYKQELGSLLVDSVQWVPTIAFYLLYPAALLFFVLLPALREQEAWQAFYSGAFLGLIAYAAYDLTNLATLKNWPVMLALADMAWGTAVSAVSCWIAFCLYRT